MKNEMMSKINANNFGLRSYSYLKNSFNKVNKVPRELSPRSLQASNHNTLLSSLQALKHSSSINNNPILPTNKQLTYQPQEMFSNDSFKGAKRLIDEDQKHNQIIEEITQSNEELHFAIEPRIDYVLNCLDLNCISDIFELNLMSFNDVLFLSKEDYCELGLSMIQRNRLIKFCEAYLKYAKDYSYEEVMLFFKENRNYLIKKTDREQKNNYNNNQRNSNQGNSASLSRNNQLTIEKGKKKVVSGNRYNNEVFMPENLRGMDKETNTLHSNYQSRDREKLNEAKPKERLIYQAESFSPQKPNQIQHIELQFSSSMSSMSNGYKFAKIRKYKTPSVILSHYNRINQEIDEYLISHSRKNTLINEKHSTTTHSSFNCNTNNSRYRATHTQRSNPNANTRTNPRGTSHKKEANVKEKQMPDNAGGTHTLNRNDSLTDLHKDTSKPSAVDILTECIRKKDELKSSLNHCNGKIIESRKVLSLS